MPRPGRQGDASAGLRTSSRDRDQVIDLLSEFFADGRLSAEEYDARVDRAMRVGTYRELHALVEGLPVDPKRLPQAPARSRRPVALAVGTSFVALAALGGVLWWAASTGTTAPTEVAAGPTPSATAAPTPTASREPTPEPTATPTRTAEPTATPTPTPEPSSPPPPAPESTDATGPAVTAVTRAGVGTTIVTVPWSAGVTPMIEFDVDRDDYELFTLADADGNPFFTHVDADGRGGPVSGATVMPDYEVPNDDQLRVKIETQGSWTLTLRDVAAAPVLASSGSGTGYEVGWYDGPEGVFSMSADDGNFAVWDDWRLIVNAIGPERDEGIVEAGRRLLRIEADAPWRYEIR